MEIKTQHKVIKPTVTIAPNLIRTREFLDKNGNVINPRTKEILKLKSE